MTRAFARWTLLVGGALLLAAVRQRSGPEPARHVDCSGWRRRSLAVGEFTILDASQVACVRIPAAGAQEAEYLYVAAFGRRHRERGDGTAGFATRFRAVTSPAARWRGRPRRSLDEAAGPARRGVPRRCFATGSGAVGAARGGERLRARIAARPRRRPADRRLGAHVRGLRRRTTCDSFVQSTATAKVVGQRVAIYLDDAAPAGFTQSDLDEVGALFDAHLYPIDTTAFGRESDLDDNGVVIVLLTQRVNDLSADCNTTGSIILGFFFGLDLLPTGRSLERRRDLLRRSSRDPDMPHCSAYTQDGRRRGRCPASSSTSSST